MVFHAQGGSREVRGRKGAVQGSQMDPLDGPIAGLVEGDTFFGTPLFGYGAIDPKKGGPKKSIALDQTGYGAIQRVTQGPLNRTLPAPYSPGSALSVENHYFGPWVCQSVLGTRASTARDPHRPVWPGFHPS